MIISRTPFRMSLFGGGTDFADYYHDGKYGYGAVISTTIDMYTYMTVNKRMDDMIRVGYSVTENVSSVGEIRHNIVREAMRMVGVEKGVDVIYMADVPLNSIGIGLASSSALAVGLLNALYAFQGKHVPAERLAEEACQLEIERLGNPIGKQDQYAVACGGLKRYQFNADDTVFADPVICRKETVRALEDSLLFFYTGLTRNSGSVLTEQKANINQKRSGLDHLVELTNEAEKKLEENNLSDIGRMLDEAWQIKRQLAGNVSNELIDGMYHAAKEAGAEGGKILGAGGGGFLMLYVPQERQDAVRLALRDYPETHIRFEPQGSKIIYVN